MNAQVFHRQMSLLQSAVAMMSPDDQAQIARHVQQHLDIAGQDENIGRMALSIATVQLAIEAAESIDAAVASPGAEPIPEAELPQAVEGLQRAIEGDGQ